MENESTGTVYAEFEKFVVMSHNKGILNKELLLSVLNRIRGAEMSDIIESESICDDGLGVVEVIVRVMECPDIPRRPYDDISDDYSARTNTDEKSLDAYENAVMEAYWKIHKQFEWR